MASVAIAFYRKCGFVIMTTTAGFRRLHICHGASFIFGRSQIAFIMAIATGVHACVQLVTELDISGIFNLENHVLHGMTFYTFRGRKGPLPVMTCAAGFTFFHGSHGVTLFDPEVKNGIMAGLTIIFDAFLLEVLIVVKNYLAEMGYFESYVLDVQRISG